MNLEGHGIVLHAVGLQRLVHVADDVAALAQLAQRRFHPLAHSIPDARCVLGGEAHFLQLGETAALAQGSVELLLGGAGVSGDVELAFAWAVIRTLRFADGPDEVHARAIARTEFSKYADLKAQR